MGLFGGSTKTTTNENFDTGPSSFQRPYLDDLFGSAQGLYGQSAGQSYYKGDTYAGMTDEARSALERLRGYASGQGLGSAGTISGIGSALAGNAGKAGTALDAFYGAASADPTQANIAAAGAYANNPHIDQQIGAVRDDVNRTLAEQTLPAIDRAATGTGNLNSSRAGVASGIAQRGAAEAVADASAAIRGGAYSTGMSLAEDARQANMGAMGSAAGAYGNLAGLGIDALTTGSNSAYDAYDRINGSYGAEQMDRQGQLDADFQKWLGNDTYQWDLLSRYANLVAGNQWGQSGNSTSTSKTKNSGGILNSLLGAAMTGASIYTGMKK